MVVGGSAVINKGWDSNGNRRNAEAHITILEYVNLFLVFLCVYAHTIDYIPKCCIIYYATINVELLTDT